MPSLSLMINDSHENFKSTYWSKFFKIVDDFIGSWSLLYIHIGERLSHPPNEAYILCWPLWWQGNERRESGELCRRGNDTWCFFAAVGLISHAQNSPHSLLYMYTHTDLRIKIRVVYTMIVLIIAVPCQMAKSFCLS